LLDLEQGVIDFFGDLVPRPIGEGKEDIEVSHLLTMSSVLACG
jgi:hypothetical protein